MNKEIFGKDYLLIESCGEGSFAEVFKAQSRSTGKYYAIKRLKQRYRSLDQVSHINEIVILRSIGQHPNIIKLEDVLYNSESGSVALVFEFMEHNLYELLSGKVESQINCNNSKNIEPITLIIIYQILKALAHIHSNYIFHRDIKPENILINHETLVTKLIDFGSARLSSVRGSFTDYITTRWYRAPECILTSGSYGPSVDIWAVGCILFEIMSGKPLFPGKNEIDQITKINQIIGTPSNETLAQFANNPSQNAPLSNFSFNFQKRQPLNLSILLQTTNTNLVDLMKSMLEYNPIDRISAENALDHDAFAEIRKYEKEWQQIYEKSETTLPMPKFVLERMCNDATNEIPTNENYNSSNENINNDNINHININQNLKQSNSIAYDNHNHNKNLTNNFNLNKNNNFNGMNTSTSNNPNQNDENTENNSVFLTKKIHLRDNGSAFLANKDTNKQQLQLPPNDISNGHQDNAPSKKKYNLIEARRLAAQRIRNYQAANHTLSKKSQEREKQKSLPYNFGRMNDHRNYCHPTGTSHKLSGISYQKPNPDIVVPQIPHNIIKKLG